MKTCAMPKSDNLVWVISDRSGIRQQVVHQQGMKVLSIAHDLHSQGHYQYLTLQMQEQKPAIVWIRLQGPAMGSGNRRDDRRAQFMQRLIRQQIDSGRVALLDGNVRSCGWNLMAIEELRSVMHESIFAWCRFQAVENEACKAVTRIWSNLELPSTHDCCCGTERIHFDLKHFAFDTAVAIEAEMLSQVFQFVLGRAQDTQPESKPHEASSGIRAAALHSVHTRRRAFSAPIRGGRLKERSVRFASSLTTKVMAEQQLSSKCTTISSTSKHERFRCNPTTINPTSNNMFESIDRSPHGDALQLESGKQLEAFPTEQAERQKARRKAGVVVQKRKQQVEQHQDDVGTDLSSLQLEPDELVHFLEEKETEEHLCFWTHCVFELFCTLPRQSCEPHKTVNPQLVMKNTVFWTSQEPRVHVCELFGGEGQTSRICSKLLGLRSGKNFELMCGIDLSNPNEVQSMWSYFHRTKPDVIVMAPPCRGFGPWTHLNRIINPEAFSEARATGLPLATLCAETATWQLSRGKHFVIEQPRNSAMFSLECWRPIVEFSHSAYCDQCRFALRNHKGQALQKPTIFVASSPLLLNHVSGRFCFGNHLHGKVTTEAQKWTIRLCTALARGICDLLSAMKEEDVSQAKVSRTTVNRGLNETNKSFHVRSFPTFTCPGCRGHTRKDDPRHTRDEGCKHRDVEQTTWTCPACVKHQPRSSDKHSLGPDCRWAIARTMTEGASRDRKGGHPCDPRIPASSEPTSKLRMDGVRDVHEVDDKVPGAVSGVPSASAAGSREPDPRTKRAVIVDNVAEGEAKSTRTSKRSVETQAGHDDLHAPPPDAVGAAAPCPEPELADAAIVPNPDEEPDWSRFDLGTSLQLLRSIRPNVVRRALRKLHIRWYHASARRMATLLTAAGVSPTAIALVPDIVDTCAICRAWTRPGSKSVTSTRLPERFNLQVEMDLLFVGTHVVLHLIDECIRWSAAEKIADRTTESIMKGIQQSWMQHFGPPVELISDQEGGLNETAAALLESRGCKLTLRAKGQHAGMIERHNDLLRRQIHLMDSQAIADGLIVDFKFILLEAVFAKNVLLTYGGFSPYKALYGGVPPLLDVMNEELLDDGEATNPARVRELAIRSITQATAEARTKQALASRTRPAGELQGLETGDQVEIYRPTISKDVPRWHGPAVVADLTSLCHGLVGVRWQGRNLQVRVQGCRRALAFAIIPIYHSVGTHTPIEILRRAAESTIGATLRLGWFRQNGRWVSCEANKRYGEVLMAGLHVAAVNLQLHGVVSFRFGRHVRTITGVHCDDVLLVWWEPGHFDSWCHMYLPGQASVNIAKLGTDNSAFVQFYGGQHCNC